MIYDFEYVTRRSALPKIAQEVKETKVLGLDMETVGMDPIVGHPRLLQLNPGKRTYVIDLFKTEGLGPLKKALNNPEAEVGEGRPIVVGQNLQYDQKWLLHHYDVSLWPIFDTFRASNLIHNGRFKPHDLESLYIRDLGIQAKAAPQGASDWSANELSEAQLDYAAEDVINLPALRLVQRAKLGKLGLNRVALYEFGAILPEAAIELHGFRLDKEMWLRLAEQNARDAVRFKDSLLREMPHPRGQLGLFEELGSVFNLNSPQQVKASLARMGVFLESTNRESLAAIAGEAPIVESLIKYREASKRVTSFGPKYLRHVHPVTGRIHASLYPFTGCGRYAFSSPNLQQIPRLRAFRDCFRVEAGKRLIAADFCLVAGTEVVTEHGVWPIERVAAELPAVLAVKDKKRPVFRKVEAGACIGLAPTFRVVLQDGSSVRCTAEHKWMTYDGDMVETRQLMPGTRLAHVCESYAGPRKYRTWYMRTNRNYVYQHRALAEYLFGPTPEGYQVDHIDGDRMRNVSTNLRLLPAGQNMGQGAARWQRTAQIVEACARCSKRVYGPPLAPRKYCSRACYFAARREGNNHRVISITPCGVEPVYQLTVAETHNYVLSNGLVSGNSQIELRLAAQETRDPTLLKVFREGLDPHRQTASMISGIPYDQVSKKERQGAKPLNFGILYGLMPKRLVIYALTDYGVAMTIDQARGWHRKFLDHYSGIREWQEWIMEKGKRSGISRTRSGRLRYLESETVHNELYNCVDAETEALTERGWVPGFELRRDDVLLTKSAETGELEWQGMTDLKLYPDAEGRFIEFRSKSFSAVTTPAHRWLVYNKNTGRDECRVSSKLSVHGDHRIHRTGCYEGPIEEFSDDFVRLCGWFLTDASFTHRPRKRSPARPIATLCQSMRGNPQNVVQIDALIERLGRKVWRSGPYPPSHIVTWSLDESTSERLHFLFPLRTLTPEFLTRISGRQARLLLDTMIAGDGWDRRHVLGKRSFCSASRVRADVFQMLCVLCGLSSSLRKRDMSKYKPQSRKLTNVPKQGSYWVVNVLQRDKVQIQKQHRRDFKGTLSVWCPIVPNTFFVARRKGFVYVTGNTPIQGCYPKDIRVLTREGYRCIGEVSVGEVWTGTRWSSFEKVNKGAWKRAQLLLSNGQRHDCDTRHRVLVARDTGYEFVHYSDLGTGDRVCFSPATPLEFGTVPEGACEEEFYWLGFAIENGNTNKSRNYLQLSIGDRKERYEHREKVAQAEVFFSRWRPTRADEPEGKKMSSVIIEDKGFRRRWENDLGYPWGGNAHHKRVPVSVWGASLELRRAFLIGLLDADGTVGVRGQTTPSLHMCNRSLLSDVQILARTCGVESILRGPLQGGSSWRLDLNGGQLVHMLCPRFICEAFLKAVVGLGKKLRGSAKTLAGRMRAGGSTSIYTLRRICAEYELDIGVPLYAYYQLVSKEDLGFEEETYTLMVEDSMHRFDAEGVIAKNSGADGLKNSMAKVHARLRKHGGRAKLVHTIHDELIVEADDDPDLVEEVKGDLEAGMIEGMKPMLPDVDVEVDAFDGVSWADVH
jgi:DNA polymerase I-like protein with 3'-5' exonuclease and polymerase domains